MKNKSRNLRALATKALADIIIEGQSLDSALARVDNYAVAGLEKRDRGLIQELAYGCMRWYLYLDAIAGLLLDKPLKKKDQDIRLLLVVGLYQLLYMSTKPHAAVAETVAATTDMGKPWAKGLVNACLRRFLRQQQELLDRLAGTDENLPLSHPQWLLHQMRTDWPQDWHAIAEQNNVRPPMHLRVNEAKTDRDRALLQLREAGITASPLPARCGIALEQAVSVEALPGFAEGMLSVQDVSAQYAALLLDPQSNETVLDACAAPGGKTCHLLERVDGKVRLVAVELDATRAERILQNLSRLGLTAELKVADAADTASWWDGLLFDRILLDAPCSATGVIRRHPDIKYHRRPSDIDRLVEIQAKLLESLWPLLKRGGKLLYATCSILTRENESQIKHLLDQHADASEIPVSVPGAINREHGAQLLPAEGDGFYYCLVEKR